MKTRRTPRLLSLEASFPDRSSADGAAKRAFEDLGVNAAVDPTRGERPIVSIMTGGSAYAQVAAIVREFGGEMVR